jgi:hypothetical protein
MKIVSLGEQCKTAYQIRRITGDNNSGVFDWLVTPFDSLITLIETDFAGFFDLANLQPRSTGRGVTDTSTEVEFHHHFPHDDAGQTIEAEIGPQYPKQRQKFDYLQSKWRELAYADSLLFVRSGVYPLQGPQRLYQSLQKRFPRAHVRLLMVSQHDPQEDGHEGNIILCTVKNDVGHAPNGWRGRDEGWDSVLPIALKKSFR